MLVIGTSVVVAQTAPTMKQLMQDLIYPASNDMLLFVYRGEPKTEMDWANVRRSAITLAESGNLLTMPGRAPASQSDWAKDAKTLSGIGTAAYKAAQAKDFPALAALADSLDASCTACHKQYRPNVFPRSGQSTGGSK
jgi:cytochrome c556